MAFKLAEAFVEVDVDRNKLRPGLQRTKGIMMASLASAAGNIGAMMASKILGKLTDAFKLIGKLGLKSVMKAGEFEQTRIAFETFLGSAEEADKTLRALTRFAETTPFTMPGIIAAARNLVNFGERGEHLLDTLRILGNAASATGTPFGDLAVIFNQVRGVGKLLTQDFRQLSQRGVISLQEIADHFGVSQAAAQKMLTSGEVGFDDLRKILARSSEEGGKFFNLMDRQSKTLLGVWSTLTDRIDTAMRRIGGIIADNLDMTGTITAFDQLIGTLEGPFTTVIIRVTRLVGSFKDEINSLRLTVFALGTIIKSIEWRFIEIQLAKLPQHIKEQVKHLLGIGKAIAALPAVDLDLGPGGDEGQAGGGGDAAKRRRSRFVGLAQLHRSIQTGLGKDNIGKAQLGAINKGNIIANLQLAQEKKIAIAVAALGPIGALGP